MGRIRIVGTFVGLALVLSAFAASAASAQPPELGRCVKVEAVKEGKKTTYHGAYGNRGCTTLNAHKKGKYEWLPGPGAKNKYSGVAVAPSPLFRTTGGQTISCSDIVFKGEYTGAKTETATVTMDGCETPFHRPCQTNPAKEGQIEGPSALKGELGVISKAKKTPTVGWDLKGEGVLFTFQCGKPPEVLNLETIEGSVIGAVTGGGFSNIDRMSIFSVIKYKAVAGKQLPESFEGGPKDTLLLNSITEKTSEQTGLTATEESESGLGEPIEKPENQEPLEIKVK